MPAEAGSGQCGVLRCWRCLAAVSSPHYGNGGLGQAATEQNPKFYFQRLKRRWCSPVRVKGGGKGEILNFTHVSVLQKQNESFTVTKAKMFTFSMKFLLKPFFFFLS